MGYFYEEVGEPDNGTQLLQQPFTRASPMNIRVCQATIGIEKGQQCSFIRYSVSMPTSFDYIELDDVIREPLRVVNSATQLRFVAGGTGQPDDSSTSNPGTAHNSQFEEEDFFGMLPSSERTEKSNSDAECKTENPFIGGADAIIGQSADKAAPSVYPGNQLCGARQKQPSKRSISQQPTSSDVKAGPSSSPTVAAQRRSNSYPSIKSFDLTSSTQKNSNSMQTSTIRGEPLAPGPSWPPVDLRRNFVMLERSHDLIIYKVCIYFDSQAVAYNSHYFPQFMQPEISKSDLEQIILTLNGLQVLRKHRKIQDKLMSIKKAYSSIYGCIIGFLYSPMYFYYNSKLNSARKKSKVEIEAVIKSLNQRFTNDKKSVLLKLISNGDVALLMKKSG